jgi:hypothetical protein
MMGIMSDDEKRHRGTRMLHEHASDFEDDFEPIDEDDHPREFGDREKSYDEEEVVSSGARSRDGETRRRRRSYSDHDISNSNGTEQLSPLRQHSYDISAAEHGMLHRRSPRSSAGTKNRVQQLHRSQQVVGELQQMLPYTISPSGNNAGIKGDHHQMDQALHRNNRSVILGLVVPMATDYLLEDQLIMANMYSQEEGITDFGPEND